MTTKNSILKRDLKSEIRKNKIETTILDINEEKVREPTEKKQSLKNSTTALIGLIK